MSTINKYFIVEIWKRICLETGRSFSHLSLRRWLIGFASFLCCESGFAQQPTKGEAIVYFKTASFSIDSAEAKKLDSVFSSHPRISIHSIDGYADSVDKNAYNLSLSKQRSNEVAAWIRKKYPSVTIGDLHYFGEDRPASSSDNASNRRVVIRFSWEEDVPPVAGLQADNDSLLIGKLKLDKLYFIPDKAILEPGSVEYLDQMIGLLKKYPHARFEIRGHVNMPPYQKKSEGFERQLQQLSEERAKFVYQACLEHGIEAGRMSYKGMGSSQMEFPNPKNDDEKRMNMRVEILVFSESR